MSTSLLIVLGILTVLLVLVIFYGFIRNTHVLDVRLDFIRKNWKNYDRLPSYDAMLFHPKYLHLWTYGQWLRRVGASA